MEQPAGGADPADAADGVVESLDRPLPEGVRRKVVALVSEAFGGLTVAELPSQLRQYARFTPSRRVKFAGNAMAAALESDPEFRRRIGERIGRSRPELAGPLETGAPPAAADPVDVAAAAYVLRPAGWVKLVTAAGEEAERADAERADEETRRELEKLREELERVRVQTRAETDRLRAELDASRKEAESLHRKLRSALSEVKRGEAALRRSAAEHETA
ncbi:RNA-binding protein, partial [Streptomyces sp. NPDC005899]